MQTDLKQIANLALFARIVQQGGISRCATDLGLERTTVSRRLGELERYLGVKLLDRTPRRISVTREGEVCFEQCERLLEFAVKARSVAVDEKPIKAAESIVIGAPLDIIEHFLVEMIAGFQYTHPGITIRLGPVSQSSKVPDAMFDFRFAWNAPRHADITVTKIARIPQSLFASADFVAGFGTLESPNSIESLPCIVEESSSRQPNWRFERKSKITSVPIRNRVEVSSSVEAKAATAAGLGLSLLPNHLCQASVTDCRLIRQLEEYTVPDRQLLLVTPRNRVVKRGATSLRIFLERELSNRLPGSAGDGSRSDRSREIQASALSDI